LTYNEHRRFLSTVVAVDGAGTLMVQDSRRTSTVPLGGLDMIDVSERSGGPSRMEAEWVVEAAGPGHTMQHRIAAPGGLWQTPPAQVDTLRTELQRQATMFGARLDPSLRRDGGGDAPPGPAATDQAQVATTVMPAAAPPPPAGWVSAGELANFEWRPPVAANAHARRRNFRIGYIAVTAAFMAIAAYSERDSGLAGMLLSAAVAPGILLTFCLIADWAIGRSRRFVLRVVDGVLQVPGSRSGLQTIALKGAQLSIDEVTTTTHSGGTTGRSTNTVLRVTGADGSSLQRQFPSLGVKTTRVDYLALERELRRRT